MHFLMNVMQVLAFLIIDFYLFLMTYTEMGPITFESNHYHYIAISSLPLPLHTFWKSHIYLLKIGILCI